MKINKLLYLSYLLFFLVTGCGGSAEENNSSDNKLSPKFLTSTVFVASDYTKIIQQLYISYFGRPADNNGLRNFQNQLLALGGPNDIQKLSQEYQTNNGIKLLIDDFGTSIESATLYSGDNTTFITAIYKNVLNRDPDKSGLNFWVDALNKQTLNRSNASFSIMAGALANTSLQGRADADLVNKKITIGSNFTAALANVPSNIYAGDNAAKKAREMLATITVTTDTNTFQSTIASLVSSLADSANSTPIANAGAMQSGVAGDIITLNANGSSDANNDILKYTWTLILKPTGSSAILNAPNSARPYFTADLLGSYTAKLIANDGRVDSQISTVNILVINAAPVADTGRYACASISSSQAKILFSQGHRYLDRDDDGKPCEKNDIMVESTASSINTSQSTTIITSAPEVKKCYVNGYYRSNGTYVNGYFRSC